jgi:hypothetical protein
VTLTAFSAMIANMDATLDQIANEVGQAFPAHRPFVFSPIVNSVQGDEPYDVARDFADKEDWTILTSEWLDASPGGLGSALSFLSDDAVCFYIPAYIMADLRGELNLVDPVFYLTHGIGQPCDQASTDWGSYTRQRWALLTAPQALALVHYLEWCVAKDMLGLTHGIPEALAGFWYEHASRP